MTQANNPLHGITLETLLTELVDRLGWEELGRLVAIRCFTHDPSIKSSLKFLRKEQWARDKVERLYIKISGLPVPEYRSSRAQAPKSSKPGNKPAAAKSQKRPEDKSQGKVVNAHIWGK
ncbi:VF530 family protein [Shewanella corallii]|uniref:VF530 family protein n=1 Tax=Shewanella corallii TaxID=560080 RepID=A0ABT0ND11_9GAMM|nr:VF530 family protein [Shewanella corallii]MCL2915706.1 VF530 family protein [Shewanella corallii]